MGTARRSFACRVEGCRSFPAATGLRIISVRKGKCEVRLHGGRTLDAEQGTTLVLSGAFDVVSDFVALACAELDVLVVSPPRPKYADLAVERALAIMRQELSRPRRITDLARSVGLSRAAFARRFRAAVGVPPERHWAELRMQHAARRLAETDLGLASIASEVGYRSEFAFSRAFKRWSGVAPGSYRRQRRDAPLCLAA